VSPERVCIGDLVECDGDYGLVLSLPYFIYRDEICVVDVIWSGKARHSRVDYTAFINGDVVVV